MESGEKEAEENDTIEEEEMENDQGVEGEMTQSMVDDTEKDQDKHIDLGTVDEADMDQDREMEDSETKDNFENKPPMEKAKVGRQPWTEMMITPCKSSKKSAVVKNTGQGVYMADLLKNPVIAKLKKYILECGVRKVW